MNADLARIATPAVAAAFVPPEVAPKVASDYRSLEVRIKEAKHAIEANTLRLSVELVGLQRKAIDSIHESAMLTLQLAEAIKLASGPAETAGVFVRHGRQRAAALNGIALDFFRSAIGLIGALSLSGVGAARLDGPIADDPVDDLREMLAQRVAAMTSQQRRVLSLLLAGLPNKLIAYELGICETTVKAHVSQVLQKLNVYSRARTIALFGRHGNIDGIH